MQLALRMNFLNFLFLPLQLPSVEALETAQELQQYTSEAWYFLFQRMVWSLTAGRRYICWHGPELCPKAVKECALPTRRITRAASVEDVGFLWFAMMLMEILIL